MKDLADALHKVIGRGREAYGLNTISGSDGRPTVVVMDYKGRGDVDAPVRIAG
jgi:hypothetical protein